ncbi:FkbM family methyltransferase [Roseovarius sp. SK2]|uniref:FkbM family methyltransferase n=1 Tax=Roseovarius TaxID=74030 RepID=UPI00237A5E0E|nr:FkbM family methyltransferase [Roseovarius sp. SK2]MDD9727553.1 FkbM family methyltransferase [Roseovarius sp. SK2]
MAPLTRWLDRRRNPWKAAFYDACRMWRRQNGAARLYQYGNLVPGDVVFDLGASRGEWTDAVLDQQPAAQMHQLAIGSTTGTMELSDAGDASSSVADHDRAFQVKTMSVSDFFAHTPVDRIALMKVNIEGSEYDLLPALIETGDITRIDRLQVQFHLFEPDMKALRDDIRARLDKTHHCVWSYPFVWEEWQLRP